MKILAGLALVLVIFCAGVVIHANIEIAREETRSPADGAKGRMIAVAGHQWHVLTVGTPGADPTGAPILLIHGFAVAGAETFQPWAGTQLHERSLILPDLLGYGHSERIPAVGPWYGLKAYSDALAEMLDRLGVAKVDLVGHSYGGAVAAQFALDHPDRVRRIVFIDAATYVEPSAAEGIIQLPLGIGRAVAWHAFGGGPWSINALACERVGCRWGDLARVANSTDTLRAMMRSHRLYPGSPPLADRIPQLRAPALVIWGEKDRILPLADGRRLARETRGRLVVIKDGPHMPYLRAGEAVGKAVREFLEPPQARMPRPTSPMRVTPVSAIPMRSSASNISRRRVTPAAPAAASA
jgi:pimeloyl-ACP methyl ester carboxylesterase